MLADMWYIHSYAMVSRPSAHKEQIADGCNIHQHHARIAYTTYGYIGFGRQY